MPARAAHWWVVDRNGRRSPAYGRDRSPAVGRTFLLYVRSVRESALLRRFRKCVHRATPLRGRVQSGRDAQYGRPMILQELLGIEHPIIQAPMAGVQGSALAIA